MTDKVNLNIIKGNEYPEEWNKYLLTPKELELYGENKHSRSQYSMIEAARRVALVQLAKALEGKQAEIDKAVRDERGKILRELDDIFYLAPNDDSYLRILVKALYRAIKDGRWAHSELGHTLKARQALKEGER